MARWQSGWRVTTLQELLLHAGLVVQSLRDVLPRFSHSFPKWMCNVRIRQSFLVSFHLREDAQAKTGRRNMAHSNLRIKHRHDWKPLHSLRCFAYAASIFYTILWWAINPTKDKNQESWKPVGHWGLILWPLWPEAKPHGGGPFPSNISPWIFERIQVQNLAGVLNNDKSLPTHKHAISHILGVMYLYIYIYICVCVCMSE